MLTVNTSIQIHLLSSALNLILVYENASTKFRSIHFMADDDVDSDAIDGALEVINRNEVPVMKINLNYILTNDERRNRSIQVARNKTGSQMLNVFAIGSDDRLITINNSINNKITKATRRSIFLYYAINKNPLISSDIIHFNRRLWEMRLINSIVICRDGINSVGFYTFNPFNNQFLIKLNPSRTYSVFTQKVTNLNGFQLSVFLSQDPPKAYFMPKHLQRQNDFYFGGRDGLVAVAISKLLNATFNYKSNIIVEKIIDGINFEDIQRSNLTFDLSFDNVTLP